MSENKVICPYCKSDAELVLGDEIYPHRKDLHHKYFWRCVPCDAYVGCHGLTSKPLGRLANRELRMLKIKAHTTFDLTWKRPTKKMSRSKAYSLLAKKLNIPKSECHIGMFNTEMCNKVIEVCKDKSCFG